MANIAHETFNTARSAQLSGPSRKVLDTKGPQGPRKVLAELQNVQPSKNVSFEDSNPSLLKHPSKKTTQLNRSAFNTPGNKPVKTKTPAIKSASRPKSNGIKIYADNNPQVSNSAPEVKNSKYDTPETKEYMAPCTDREWRIPLPEYVERTLKMRPTFNIDYFSRDSTKKSETQPIDQLTDEVCALTTDDCVFPEFKEQEAVNNADWLLAVDHDLLDDGNNFSLPSLPTLDEW